MTRTLLNSKIHRATVTGAELHYIGSISLDEELMRCANIRPFEKVEVVNVSNGRRWETYTIEAPAGSRTVEVRGGGARLVSVGDILIIMTYVQVDEPVPEEWTPRIVLVDERNRVAEIVRVDSRGSLLAARKHEIERHEAPPRT